MSTPTYPYRHRATGKVAKLTEAQVSAFPDGLYIRIPESSTDPYFTGDAKSDQGIELTTIATDGPADATELTEPAADAPTAKVTEPASKSRKGAN